jgi:hypothetical protein
MPESTEEQRSENGAVAWLERVEITNQRLQALIESYSGENRWWRAGLIAALLLVAMAFLIGGNLRASPDPGPGPGGVYFGYGAPQFSRGPGAPYMQFMPLPPPPRPGLQSFGGCGPERGGLPGGPDVFPRGGDPS